VRIASWFAPFLAGAVALLLGQDASWDLRNYHYYAPHAWLTGRLDRDIAVAHLASFYNPTLHLPFHWLVRHLEPAVVGALLGALAGCNLWCLVAIAARVDAADGQAARPGVVLPLALAGLLGAMFVSEVGTSFGDNLLSLPVLAAVAWALRELPRLRDGPGRVRAAVGPALLCGAAAGLKLPFALYGIALAAALLCVPRTQRGRWEVLLACGAAGLGGALLTGGWWALEMWQRFGNPVFPYFNGLFGSPWAGVATYRDPRFLPEDAWQALQFPFYFVLAPRRLAEVEFVDLRFPLLYLALLALGMSLGARRWAARRDAASTPGAPERLAPGAVVVRPGALVDRFLLVFVVVAFVAWMQVFGIARYLVAAELLAPVAIWAALRRLRPVRPPGVATALSLLALLALTGSPAHWDRRPWSEDYFDVDLPRFAEPGRTLVLMAGNEPSAYQVPFMPPATRVLRIEGYFTGPSAVPNETDRLMQRVVRAHEGPVLFLFRSYERPRAGRAAAAFGLGIAEQGCRSFLPGIEPDRLHPFLLCHGVRLQP
jgi:hypothetical protein